jgi:hypothetical protein
MDASKAFQNVLLEQISFSLIKQLNTNDFVTIGALDQGNELVRIFGAFSLKVYSQKICGMPKFIEVYAPKAY